MISYGIISYTFIVSNIIPNNLQDSTNIINKYCISLYDQIAKKE